MTEILSQFEINAKMDISKNQWRSTGGIRTYCPNIHTVFLKKLRTESMILLKMIVVMVVRTKPTFMIMKDKVNNQFNKLR